jgi:glycosyltransferase involved in cell wall biosynthesis
VRLLYAIKEGHLPDVVDGGVLDIHQMALALQAQGHEVSVVAARMRERRHLSRRLVQKLARGRILASADTKNGYLTTRMFYWQIAAWLDRELTARRPDAIIVQGSESHQVARVAVDHDVPVLIRMVTAECPERLFAAARGDEGVARLLDSPMVKLVSNSRYVAGLVESLFGCASPVDYPFIERAHSTVGERSADCVTFVNPRQIKGLDIALEVAALLPHRQFIFAESHVLTAAERKALGRELKRLPNVSFRRCTTSLRDVYGRTALLMAPSRFREAFGRVIVEACANGIPVVARNIGGIPEAMGSSGLLLDRTDPAELWAKSIEGILTDPDRYAELASIAVANAQRAELAPVAIAAQFLETVRIHANQEGGHVPSSGRQIACGIGPDDG